MAGNSLLACRPERNNVKTHRLVLRDLMSAPVIVRRLADGLLLGQGHGLFRRSASLTFTEFHLEEHKSTPVETNKINLSAPSASEIPLQNPHAVLLQKHPGQPFCSAALPAEISHFLSPL